MAKVSHLKVSEEEVRVLQGRLAIETEAVISDSERDRVSDLLNSMFEGNLPHVLRSDGWTESARASPAFVALTLEVRGFRFLCCCPRVVPFRTNEIAKGRLAPQDICLLMFDPAEPC